MSTEAIPSSAEVFDELRTHYASFEDMQAAIGTEVIEHPSLMRMDCAWHLLQRKKHDVKIVQAHERCAKSKTAPEWACGFDVAALKNITAIYKAHDKPYVVGAFTAIKDSTIAEWLHGEQLYAALERGEPKAFAVASIAGGHMPVTDFSGAAVGWVERNQLLIHRLCCVKGHEYLLQMLVHHLMSGRMLGWCEIWQECEAEREALKALHFRWISSKIPASSELVGLWHYGQQTLPRVSLVEQCALERLQIPVLNVEPLRIAIEQAQPKWSDHYSSYNKKHTWSAVALRGYGGDADFIIKPAEMSKKWKAENPEKMEWTIGDTALREELPEAEPLIAAIPGEKHRIRLMRLAPKEGELTRHADITDPDAGVALGKLLRIHIPITTNPKVVFAQWLLDGRKVERQMAVGEAWYLDTRKPHTAVNAGEDERVHLVMDVESSPALINLLPLGK